MTDLVKYISFAATNKYGEPSVQPILKGGLMEKVATTVHPLIKQAAADLPPREDGIWVLVNALGAQEFWGSNCLTPETLITMADGTLKEIKDIKVGDMVLSARGVPRRVNELYIREKNGPINRIRVTGATDSIRVTDGHGIPTISRAAWNSASKKYRWDSTADAVDMVKFASSLEPEKVMAGDMKKGAMLQRPIARAVSIDSDLDGVDMAWFLGYYAAEGCIARSQKQYKKKDGSVSKYGEPKPSTVILTQNMDEVVLAEAVNDFALKRFGKPAKIDENYRDSKARRISIYVKRLARICDKHVPGVATTKRLSAEIMAMPTDWQSRFIAGWLDGDGCVSSSGKEEGKVRGNTSSRHLALQMQMIMHRLGIRCNANKGVQQGDLGGKGNAYYELSIASSESAAVAGLRVKSERQAVGAAPGVIVGDTVHVNVASVVAEQYTGKVYNINVDVDHSYVANGVGVLNSNGDAFPEESLKHACPMGECTRDLDFGHKTFEKYAFPYRHHVNKDPAKSIGERVKVAVWNDEMKRVELIHFMRREPLYDPFGDIEKVGAADLIDQIEGGSEVHVSMGCKVPYDVCSICHNKAKNTSLYCEHLKLAMNQVMPDGRTACAVNLHPRFFDISYVLKGAEKTARVLKKLAAAKDDLKQSKNRSFSFIAEGLEKAASENREYVLPSALYAEIKMAADEKKPAVKNGEMKKKVPSNMEPDTADVTPQVDKAVKVLRRTEPAIPDDVIKRMAAYKIPEIASTLAGLGMSPTPGEMRRITVIKIRGGKGTDELGSPTVTPSMFRPSLASLLKEQMCERSALRGPLRQRTLKLLSESSDSIRRKVAASDELAPGSLGDMAEQTTDKASYGQAGVKPGQTAVMARLRPGLDKSILKKAAPNVALGEALCLLTERNLASADLDELFEKGAAFAAVQGGVDWNVAFALADDANMEKMALPAAKIGLTGGKQVALGAGLLAAPYLASGYVQQKSKRGLPISEREAWVARNPGVLGVGAAAAGLLANKHIGLLASGLKKVGASNSVGNAGANDYNISIKDVLRYGTDPDLVDAAIIAGLNKVAERAGI